MTDKKIQIGTCTAYNRHVKVADAPIYMAGKFNGTFEHRYCYELPYPHLICGDYEPHRAFMRYDCIIEPHIAKILIRAEADKIIEQINNKVRDMYALIDNADAEEEIRGGY